MKKFVVEFKEVGNDHVMTTTFIGEKTREEVVEFYGLENPDVEWYKIKEE